MHIHIDKELIQMQSSCSLMTDYLILMILYFLGTIMSVNTLCDVINDDQLFDDELFWEVRNRIEFNFNWSFGLKL